MNILYLSLRVPYPPHRGDRIRAYHFLKQISQQHSVSLIAFHDEGDPTEARAALGRFCQEVHLIPHRKRRAQMRCLAFAWTDTPLQVQYWYDPHMQRTIRHFLDTHPCDLIHVHFFRMAPYVREVGGIPKLLDLCDALSLNLSRRAALDRSLVWPLLKLEARRVERYEVEIMRHFDGGTLVSEIDRAVLIARNPSLPLHVLPMGVDLDYFTPHGSEKRADILFTGTMNYFPNVDAACFFYHEVFPRVKQVVPDARFVVGGSHPSPKLQQLAHRADILVTGSVPDMRPYFEKASVFVSPMRAGSGMQTKNLEAMAMGLPVVTTPVGMEGLEARPGEHLLLGQDPEELAQHVITLLTDRDYARQIGENARRLMEQRYSWNAIGEKLQAIYRTLAREETAYA